MRTHTGGGYSGAARHHTIEDAFMVPGMGAQPVPVKEWVAANDNQPHVDFELAETTFAPLEELPVAEQPASEWLTEEKKKEIYDWITQPIGEHVVPPRPAFPERHGDFMQTYTGRKFFPMDPRANEVCIRDIAHSLSLQCRYAGHCRRFYSVAEHSVLVARWLRGQTDAQTAMFGLLHDASEAYLIDVPRPVKPALVGYKAAEARVMAAVCARFGLQLEMPAVVHEADDRIIADELVNLVPMDWHARHDDPLGVTLRYWSPAEAEEEFLETFKALCGDRVGEVG